MKSFLPSLLLLFWSTTGFASVTASVHESHAFNPDGVVELVNVNGNIEISAWSKNEVSVDAEKSANHEDELRDIEIEVAATASSLSVKTVYPQHTSRSSHSSVTYKLHVPAGARLAVIKGVNSSITVIGVQGGVSCETVNGPIKVVGTANNLSLTSVNGGIFAESDQLPGSSQVNLKTVNGGCELRLGGTVNATIDAHTLHGRVHCDLPGASSQSGNHLKTTVGTGVASINLSSVNGGVTVAQK